MKRTRLNRMSAKKRKEIAETTPLRRAFREEIGRCMLCQMPSLYEGFGLEVHEMLGGTGNRPKAVYLRELWLLLCGICHKEVQGWKLAKQLALKLREDPWWFDLDAVRKVYGGGELVNMEDIRRHRT